MGRRLELHELLVDILGSRNVYFQPGPNVTMNYPAIVYGRDYAAKLHADNLPYRTVLRYQVTLIDRNPDSEVVDKLNNLPMCSYVRNFASDGLNHDIFDLYF